MKFSMTGQEKGDLLIQVGLIEVAAWAGLTVLTKFIRILHTPFQT
jgi:hypothetical protein